MLKASRPNNTTTRLTGKGGDTMGGGGGGGEALHHIYIYIYIAGAGPSPRSSGASMIELL